MDTFSCCWGSERRRAVPGNGRQEDAKGANGRGCHLPCGGGRSGAAATLLLDGEGDRDINLAAIDLKKTRKPESPGPGRGTNGASGATQVPRGYGCMVAAIALAAAAVVSSGLPPGHRAATAWVAAAAAAAAAAWLALLGALRWRSLAGGTCGADSDVAQVAARAREVREAAWCSLGLREAEIAMVRELLLCLRGGGTHAKGRAVGGQGADSDQRLGSSGSHAASTGAAEVDFVTAWRFLLAGQWDVPQAEDMLRAALDRRESFLAAALLPLCRQLAAHWRGQGFAGTDFDGDPVLWERPGLLDWQGFSALGEEFVVCCEVLCLENLARHLDRLTVEERRPVHRVGVVVDLYGLPMSFARPQHLKVLRLIIRLASDLHPETLKWVLLVRPPRKFAPVWKVVESYFGPRTREKLKVVPAEETQSVLQRHVPREHIPRFLGGPSRLPRQPAGKIPRRLLRRLAEEGSAGKLNSVAAAASAAAGAAADAPTSQRGLSLLGLPSRFRRQPDLFVKEAAFPRSSWAGPGGELPPRHSWGSLSDVSGFPAPRRSGAPSAAPRALLELLDLELFRSSEEDPIFQAYDHPGLAPQQLRKQGENRFLLVVNWIIGPYQQVAVAAVNEPAADATMGELAEWRMWQRFLTQPVTARWRRLRVTAHCFEGPFIVHELMKTLRPSHVGKFLPSHGEGPGYLEVAMHLNSSEMRRLRVVFQHSYHLIVNGLAYFLCGEGPAEPPERLLFAHYCSFVDVQKLRQV